MEVTIAGPSGSRFRRAVLAVVFMVGVAEGDALAQSFQTMGSGINWGRFNIYPSARIGYGYDSNIFYTSEDLDTTTGIVSSREFEVQPRLMFELLGVKAVRAFDATVVIVSLSARAEQTTRLVGSCLTEADPARGAALAVLNATNRLLGNYLATR